ncbi:MAG TPA: IclR family transcriptional regulator [Armatimonadota bacterium]|nr:IclR family transcriptional regulator [Armatimonadota bacterium]HPU00249.1 IclR family transcriptional regulator [Armatimonadota bacterium]
MAATVPIQSIKRALDVLDALMEQGLGGEGVSLQAIAGRLGVPPSTAHNILKTMVMCGYVARDDQHLYRLGPRCRDLARGSTLSAKFMAAAQGTIHSLAERTGESVVFATLVHGRRYPLLRADGHAVVRVSPTYEELSAFFRMVTGRVLAAYATPEELGELLAVHGLPGESWNGIETEEALGAALAEVRRAGMAEEECGRTQVYSLAVPVLDAREQLLGALGIHLPASRATPEHREKIRREIAAAAKRLGQQA